MCLKFSVTSFVCAVPALHAEHPRHFRTYEVRENPSANCTIWEAARATTAAPTFFKRISISEPGHPKEDFIDAGIKCNNPTSRLIQEACLVFGSDHPVACVVSIGTGHPGTIGLDQPSGLQKVVPSNLVHVLAQLATNCEDEARYWEHRLHWAPNKYFRFNVEHGIETISLAAWKHMGEVVTCTHAYLENLKVKDAINVVVSILSNPDSMQVPLTLARISM